MSSYNKTVNSGKPAERTSNNMKTKIINTALTLGGAAVIWFAGWGGLLFLSRILNFLNL